MTDIETPVEIAPTRRPRATVEEMNARKKAAVEVARNSPAPVTLDQIREALDLAPATAVALVRSLIEERQLTVAGKNGRRLLLRPTRGGAKPKTEVATAPSATTPAPAVVKPPKGLNVNEILRDLHIGAAYKMVGLAVRENEGITIDLVDQSVPGGRVLTVALAGAK